MYVATVVQHVSKFGFLHLVSVGLVPGVSCRSLMVLTLSLRALLPTRVDSQGLSFLFKPNRHMISPDRNCTL